VNTRQQYNKPSVTTLSKVSVAGQQALSLLIVVIIILLLSGSGWRLRWRG
jgi:hypothetical protein